MIVCLIVSYEAEFQLNSLNLAQIDFHYEQIYNFKTFISALRTLKGHDNIEKKTPVFTNNALKLKLPNNSQINNKLVITNNYLIN